MKYKFPYQEQYNRISRLRDELNLYTVATDKNFEIALDKFTSFFIQCYHLRDWIINSGYLKSKVDKFVRSNTYLSLCRDLANNQKHQKITKYVPANFVDFGIGISTPISRYYDYIKKQARFGIDVWEFKAPVDVIEVADRCLKSWQDFLLSLQLNAPN
ncbi:MAG: hypothetical protein AAB529_01415 [Patescibacteria group bacterium]